MDILGYSVNKAAVRLAVSSILFFAVQMGLIDPLIADKYREQVVDMVSAIMVIIFAIEFVMHSALTLWHQLKSNTVVVSKPGKFETLLNGFLSKFIQPAPVTEAMVSTANAEEPLNP